MLKTAVTFVLEHPLHSWSNGSRQSLNVPPKSTLQLLARCGRVADRFEHPGSGPLACWHRPEGLVNAIRSRLRDRRSSDRKSTRLNSSHGYISYAVFCLKKKKNTAATVHTS